MYSEDSYPSQLQSSAGDVENVTGQPLANKLKKIANVLITETVILISAMYTTKIEQWNLKVVYIALIRITVSVIKTLAIFLSHYITSDCLL